MTLNAIHRRLARDTAAVTAMEFGIIGNVLMLLLLAGLEIGIMIWTQSTLQEVAGKTARCLAIGYTTCSGTGANSAASYAVGLAKRLGLTSAMIATSDVTATQSATCENATGGAYWVVTINFPYWVGPLAYPIKARTQSVTACFPY